MCPQITFIKCYYKLKSLSIYHVSSEYAKKFVVIMSSNLQDNVMGIIVPIWQKKRLRLQEIKNQKWPKVSQLVTARARIQTHLMLLFQRQRSENPNYYFIAHSNS